MAHPHEKFMSWKKSKFGSSLMSLLGEATAERNPQSGMLEIRQAMLDCLDTVGAGAQYEHIWNRVRFAPDIQALWYLRADVMALLADQLGETAANVRILTITEQFRGLLPAAQKSRPNRLRG
jgi:hypothetical protein